MGAGRPGNHPGSAGDAVSVALRASATPACIIERIARGCRYDHVLAAALAQREHPFRESGAGHDADCGPTRGHGSRCRVEASFRMAG